MTSRRNAFVKLGRPLKAPKAPKMPTEALSTSVPASAFKSGGSVGGYQSMPAHHDCPAMHNLRRKDC